jgi:thiol-disulfide isomerase/thioredoxin
MQFLQHFIPATWLCAELFILSVALLKTTFTIRKKEHMPTRTLAAICFQTILSTLAIAQGSYKVEGTIKKATAKDLVFAVYKTHLAAAPELTSTMLTNGSYQLPGALDKPAFAELIYKAAHLKIYLEPGDELNISFPDSSLSAVSITGKGSDNNLFYNKYVKEFGVPVNDSAATAQMLNMQAEEYRKELQAVKQRQLAFLDRFPGKDKLSESFLRMINNDIEYRYLGLLYAYPVVRANSNPLTTDMEQLPPAVTDASRKATLNNDEALISDAYRAFINYFIKYSAVSANGFKKFTDPLADADKQVVVAKEKLQGMVFNNWLARFCIEEKEVVAPPMLRSMMNTLLLSDKNMVYYPAVNNICAQRMAVQDAPVEGELQITATPVSSHLSSNVSNDDIGMVDTDGKPFLLNQLKGKVVYIDFWASWCGPCRGMMPYSKQLHDQLTAEQKKQIEFLYISIDGDQESWKQSMAALGMEGRQVNSPGNWQSRVCSYFQINSIPRYMIMDKNGSIVNFDAKRPADPGVMDELLKLAAQ